MDFVSCLGARVFGAVGCGKVVAGGGGDGEGPGEEPARHPLRIQGTYKIDVLLSVSCVCLGTYGLLIVRVCTLL